MTELEFDPTEMTVEAVREAVPSIDDPGVLADAANAERNVDDRSTALEAIESRAEALFEAMDVADPEEYPTPDDEDEEDDEDEDEYDDGSFISVRNWKESGQHVAGHSFSAGEIKRVRMNGKIRQAIVRGKLQVV